MTSRATTGSTRRVRPLRIASLLLAFAAATGLVLGSAGFASIDADRGVEVSVVDEDDAYLGVNATADAVAEGESTPTLDLRNRFGGPIETVEVDAEVVVSGNATVEAVDPPEAIPVGDAAPVNVTLRCPTGGNATIAYDVTATGSDVRVDTTAEQRVACRAGNGESVSESVSEESVSGESVSGESVSGESTVALAGDDAGNAVGAVPLSHR